MTRKDINVYNVIPLVRKGYSNYKIAKILKCSPDSVRLRKNEFKIGLVIDALMNYKMQTKNKFGEE